MAMACVDGLDGCKVAHPLLEIKLVHCRKAARSRMGAFRLAANRRVQQLSQRHGRHAAATMRSVSAKLASTVGSFVAGDRLAVCEACNLHRATVRLHASRAHKSYLTSLASPPSVSYTRCWTRLSPRAGGC